MTKARRSTQKTSEKQQKGSFALSLQDISQAITAIENRDPGIFKRLEKCFSAESLKKTVCFTGPAGVGKSTFISSLVSEISSDKKLAWVACDPSSLKSGGSLLGDRIRISGKQLSPNIFIRSMSTRSTLAFSPVIKDVEIFLESLFDEVWVETAGVGQTQQEVASISGVTVLMIQPETGDDIQSMKSGVRELADLFVVHKSDLPGAEAVANSLIHAGAPADRVLMVSSQSQKGLAEFLKKLKEVQSKIDWKKRLPKLHLDLKKDLLLEKLKKQIDKKITATSKAANPYKSV